MPKRRNLDPSSFSRTLRSRHKKETATNYVSVFSSSSDTDADDLPSTSNSRLITDIQNPSTLRPSRTESPSSQEGNSENESGRENENNSTESPQSQLDSEMDAVEAPLQYTEAAADASLHEEGPGSPNHPDDGDTDMGPSSDADADDVSDNDDVSESDDDEERESSGAENDAPEHDLRWRLDDQPLYPGAPLNVIESLVATLVFILTHSLTGVAVADLLTLIALHCVQPHFLKLTLHKFKKYRPFLKEQS